MRKFISYIAQWQNHDQGASWLSTTKEVLNPYYGDMMLRCGEMKKGNTVIICFF